MGFRQARLLHGLQNRLARLGFDCAAAGDGSVGSKVQQDRWAMDPPEERKQAE
jgi:hypothetical protein